MSVDAIIHAAINMLKRLVEDECFEVVFFGKEIVGCFLKKVRIVEELGSWTSNIRLQPLKVPLICPSVDERVD